MLNPLHSCNISAKIQKNIQKVDYMDGFCWQGELDLTLFYKIENEYMCNTLTVCFVWSRCFLL